MRQHFTCNYHVYCVSGPQRHSSWRVCVEIKRRASLIDVLMHGKAQWLKRRGTLKGTCHACKHMTQNTGVGAQRDTHTRTLKSHEFSRAWSWLVRVMKISWIFTVCCVQNKLYTCTLSHTHCLNGCLCGHFLTNAIFPNHHSCLMLTLSLLLILTKRFSLSKILITLAATGLLLSYFTQLGKTKQTNKHPKSDSSN